jgi:DNA-binding response OmpR family regulator
VNVLVVEDSSKLATFLCRVLTEEGFAVDVSADGEEALDQAVRGNYDLVILDWMLPSLDGLTVCRRLRGQGNTVPILMLTARAATGERVLGLEAGADDFLVKPFEVEELVARVRALLRRTSGYGSLRFGALLIEPRRLEVRLNGEPLHLTSREYALLLHLAHHADRPVRRSELLAGVWGTAFDSGSNVVEVHMSRLRDKLGDHGSLIETVRGVGYRLRRSV